MFVLHRLYTSFSNPQLLDHSSKSQLTWEQIDVIHMGVCPLEPLNQRWRHLPPQPLEAGCPGQITDGSIVVIAGDAVVPSSLDVQGGQV